VQEQAGTEPEVQADQMLATLREVFPGRVVAIETPAEGQESEGQDAGDRDVPEPEVD
jgi:hypothetical protein